METLFDGKCEVSQLSPLTLAFIGDTVYDMFVREMLVTQANRPVKKLHETAVQSVRASAQAKAYDIILPLLTEQEEVILKRGRNAHVNHIPKNGNPADYHHATAVETLFGWLYLSGETQRLRELFSAIIKEDEKD